VHVRRSGDIGLFKIVAETGVAAGVRRVEAVTGDVALARVQDWYSERLDLAATLGTNPDSLYARVQQVKQDVPRLEKELARLKARLASAQGDDLLTQCIR
jgi:alanyl-tRNA synthetase